MTEGRTIPPYVHIYAMFPVCVTGDRGRFCRLDAPVTTIADGSGQLFYGDPDRVCSG